jgi:hypothetical protein
MNLPITDKNFNRDYPLPLVSLIGCRKGEAQSMMLNGKEEQAEIAAKRYHQDKRNNPITDSRPKVQKGIV